MTVNNKLKVEAIYRGTVIDHIPAHVGMKLLSIFKLTVTHERITIGLNLPSSKYFKKDIIKLENIFLNDLQANQLSIYAPYATVNLIDKYYVVQKKTLSLPKKISKLLACLNTNCISKQLIFSDFEVKKKKGKIYLKCIYCENEFKHETLILDH